MSTMNLELPLVSVVIPTKNSEQFVKACLRSIRNQTYPRIECIVVDNFSTDATVTIARTLADRVYQIGPERSAQVNFGVANSFGEYVFRVDSDFILDPEVVEQAVNVALSGYEAVVVHNSPDLKVSRLAKVRRFEVDMYKFDMTHSAARFILKSTYLLIGGYDSVITAGEDYDLQNRLNEIGAKTGFISAEAIHLGEPVDLMQALKKYYTYGKDFKNFLSKNGARGKFQVSPLRLIYLRKWRQFVRHPILGTELLIYHTMRFIASVAGYTSVRLLRR
ncbi:MAG: glycosyltransferase family 2 protein [Nitrososphaerota archaeon]|nr:glycosyltransferase family 2 protein [Nitrososphaerota archaeon]